MIGFHGRPFLQYLIEMLREQGFERILLLLGYLPEVIQNHFGDGRTFGVSIEYSVTNADALTGQRLRTAAPFIDDCFMLLYCDNYWPVRMREMWLRFSSAEAPAMVTVYTNRDKYSRDGVRVSEDGYVDLFDRTRTADGLAGVEIGFAILRKQVLDLLPEHDALFEDAVYPPLIARRRLLAYRTDHRYYSVGSLERLPVTEKFLAREPAVILDRDGVLNRRPAKGEYVRTPGDFVWLPGAREALREFTAAGYRVVIASNQAGIARRQLTETDLAFIHARMKWEAAEAGGRIDGIYYCIHHWDDGCECRKPLPGMLFQAQRDLDLDLTRTWFIGDDERDAQAAQAAGCPFGMVSEHTTLLDICRSLIASRLSVAGMTTAANGLTRLASQAI
jgi:D-glycero-D-manno-heptose 1,7-bisphosphate phosphatase